MKKSIRKQTGDLIAELVLLRRVMGFDARLIAPWEEGLRQLMGWNGWTYQEAKEKVLEYSKIIKL